MATDPKNPNPATNPFLPEGGRDSSGEAVQRHLQDQHHQISDEDIRNVRVGKEDDEPVTTGAELEARLEDEDKGHHPPNPWDVKQ